LQRYQLTPKYAPLLEELRKSTMPINYRFMVIMEKGIISDLKRRGTCNERTEVLKEVEGLFGSAPDWLKAIPESVVWRSVGNFQGSRTPEDDDSEQVQGIDRSGRGCDH